MIGLKNNFRLLNRVKFLSLITCLCFFTVVPSQNVDKDSFDKVLDQNPLIPSQVKQKESPVPDTEKKNKAKIYRLQLLTVADFEVAQAKQKELADVLGAPVEVSFEAPFYKLKFGSFSSRREAEKRLDEIKEMGVEGFPVQE